MSKSKKVISGKDYSSNEFLLVYYLNNQGKTNVIK